jgi:hypothetical protein
MLQTSANANSGMEHSSEMRELLYAEGIKEGHYHWHDYCSERLAASLRAELPRFLANQNQAHC